ncbi:amidase signature enzyme [Rhizoclosmatium globosum]|uniref:Amidase signature enzyme n=1 Tax=Rhizoclosmatium globosum TaxID=329046 RepID=A0A1Y2D2X5_9FUNG|nr:amidase signature enzyme [Rhizoclosmatium globosum]|eukprot:ORY53466.1 amidase signature enzyme [Rhizoclosmatium globosum]
MSRLSPSTCWQSGFMSLRKLPPNLLRLGITTEALPPRSYKHRNYNGESLDLDAFMSLQVDSQGGTVSSLDLHQSFVSGQTTPLTVAESLLKKLVDSKQIGPNGYLNDVHPSDVLLQAEASTKRYQSGKPRSVLDGVPVVVKNEFDVQGYRTRVGTRFINVDAVAEYDADIVKNLRDLGAIIVGVTNMVEVGYSPVDEKLRNPWNKDHSCGGSSSGSGGAVGGGFVPLAIGCDGGGSIRLPAAFCGAYGLKPTCSRLSAKGEFPSCPTVAVGGPIAATASDLCIGYLAMADRSRHLPPVHVPRDFLKFSVTGLRVGVMREYNAQVFNPAITQALNRVESELIKQGATIVPIEFPYLELVRIAHLITIGSELTATLEADPSGNSHMMSYSNAINSAGINCLGTMDYIHAQKLRTYAINRLCSLFDSKSNDAVDLILSPTAAVTAPKLPS